MSSEHLVAQVGKEIDPYIAGFRVTSEEVEDKCSGSPETPDPKPRLSEGRMTEAM